MPSFQNSYPYWVSAGPVGHFDHDLAPMCTLHSIWIVGKIPQANEMAGQGVKHLQYNSDPALGFMLCDVGAVDFWVSEADLLSCRFKSAMYLLLAVNTS